VWDARSAAIASNMYLGLSAAGCGVPIATVSNPALQSQGVLEQTANGRMKLGRAGFRLTAVRPRGPRHSASSRSLASGGSGASTPQSPSPAQVHLLPDANFLEPPWTLRSNGSSRLPARLFSTDVLRACQRGLHLPVAPSPQFSATTRCAHRPVGCRWLCAPGAATRAHRR